MGEGQSRRRGSRNANVQAKAVAEAVEQGADALFRRRVLSPNATHVPTAAFFGEPVFVHKSFFYLGSTRMHTDVPLHLQNPELCKAAFPVSLLETPFAIQI